MSRDINIFPNRGTTASGSEPKISFSGASAGTINLVVEDAGDVVYEGDTGDLFSIVDTKDGLLSSVNDVSGLPITSVWSDNRVQMGKWDDLAMIIKENQVFIGPTGVTTSLLFVSGGTITYKDGNETDGYILTSDSGGTMTWQAAASGATGTAKYADDIAFTGGTKQTITHSLGTEDVQVQLKDSTGTRIIEDVADTYTSNTVDIEVSITGTYRVIIIG